jgi:putative flippase GtrA
MRLGSLAGAGLTMDFSYVLTPFLAWLVAGVMKFTINSIKARQLAFGLIGYGRSQDKWVPPPRFAFNFGRSVSHGRASVPRGGRIPQFDDWGLYLAMIIGTGAGLVTSTCLDKRWIFYHQSASKSDDARIFLLYVFFGGLITSVFYVAEIAFDYYFASPWAKYLGATVGLGIGYTTKYHFDKRYVFIEQTP